MGLKCLPSLPQRLKISGGYILTPGNMYGPTVANIFVFEKIFLAGDPKKSKIDLMHVLGNSFGLKGSKTYYFVKTRRKKHY